MNNSFRLRESGLPDSSWLPDGTQDECRLLDAAILRLEGILRDLSAAQQSGLRASVRRQRRIVAREHAATKLEELVKSAERRLADTRAIGLLRAAANRVRKKIASAMV